MKQMSIIILVLSLVVAITIIFMISKKDMSKYDKPKLDLAAFYSNESLCDTVDERHFNAFSTTNSKHKQLTKDIPETLLAILQQIDVRFFELINLLIIQASPIPETASTEITNLLRNFVFKTDTTNENIIYSRLKFLKEAIDNRRIWPSTSLDAESFLYKAGYNNSTYANISITDPQTAVSQVWPLYHGGSYYIHNIVHDYSAYTQYSTEMVNQFDSLNHCNYLLTNESEIKSAIADIKDLQARVDFFYNTVNIDSINTNTYLNALYNRYFSPG